MIPRKKQATPQAPAREFKPRKNGAPAVPATPPANIPQQRQAQPVQQPPIRGAQQSVGQPPVQRAPQRAQRRFNPMQGPSGSNMGTARQAAATMFMPPVPRQQPQMPSAAGGGARAAGMQRSRQMPMQAPVRRQATQPMPQRQKSSPQQEAALDMFGPMFARSGDVPVPDPGFGNPQVDAFIEQDRKESAPGPGGLSQDDLMVSGGQFIDTVAPGQPSFDDEQASGIAKVTEIPENLQGDHLVGPGYIDTDGDGLADIYVSQGGVGIGGNISEDERRPGSGMSLDQLQEMVSSGKYSGVGTGAQAGTSGGSELTDALEEAILALLTEDSEGLYSDEELAAQAQSLIKDAAEAKQDLAMKMAMRGMGASGLAGAGFGNIDSQLIDTINDLALQSKALGTEVDLKKLGIAGPLLANLLNDETRRLIAEKNFDYMKEQDALSNQGIFLNNLAAEFGAEKWDPESASEIGRLMEEGVPWWKIKKYVTVTPAGTAFYTGKPGDIDTEGSSDGSSGFDKQSVDDWAGSVLSDPRFFEEESENIERMYERWKSSAANPDQFTSSEEWLDYYFGDAAGLDEMTYEEQQQYLQEKRQASRSLVAVKGFEFAPPGFVPPPNPSGDEGEVIPWVGLSSFQKEMYWEYYFQDRDMYGVGPVHPKTIEQDASDLLFNPPIAPDVISEDEGQFASES